MAKTIWKDVVKLGDEPTTIITSKLLPHVEEGLLVWFETPQEDPAPEVHTLHVVLTGQFIPDAWEWVATARDHQTGYVGHLYRSARVAY